MSSDDSGLARERTDLAEDRTLLANERTYAGWARTAFAAIGLGLGFQALFRRVEPTWVAKSVASVFVLIGIWVIWSAQRRSAALLERLGENEVTVAHGRSTRILAVATTLGAALLLVAIWLLV